MEQKGLKIKRWKDNNLFSLHSLPADTVLLSIDGVDITNMAFKDAVLLLKTSETREIVYQLPVEKVGSSDKVLSTTLRFQELNKENSPPNASISLSNSPAVGRDFWTVAKMDTMKSRSPVKTRSPTLRFKGVYTSPRLRPTYNNIRNKTGENEEWVAIPLAAQFDEVSSPQDKQLPPSTDQDLHEEVIELKKQELVDVSVNTSSILERVTPLKGKIKELESSVAGKSEEISALGGTVKELKSGSRNSDGKIALLKYQLSKTMKLGERGIAIHGEDEGTIETEKVLAHLKMCRAIQAVRSRGLEDQGTNTESQSEMNVTACESNIDVDPHEDKTESSQAGGEALQVWLRQLVVLQSLKEYHKAHSCESPEQEAQVNMSSGTLHNSVIDGDPPVNFGVQCRAEVTDAAVGGDTPSGLSPTRESAATQYCIHLDDDLDVSEGGKEGMEKRMREQDRYIGLLTKQMHVYVDCHIEALRSAAAISPTRSGSSIRLPVLQSSSPYCASSGEVLESIPLSQVPTHAPSAVAVAHEDQPQCLENSHTGSTGSVKAAFKTWQHRKNTPTTAGLSPASFKTHLAHMRTENSVTRREILSWQKKFEGMREEVNQGQSYFRL